MVYIAREADEGLRSRDDRKNNAPPRSQALKVWGYSYQDSVRVVRLRSECSTPQPPLRQRVGGCVTGCTGLRYECDTRWRWNKVEDRAVGSCARGLRVA